MPPKGLAMGRRYSNCFATNKTPGKKKLKKKLSRPSALPPSYSRTSAGIEGGDDHHAAILCGRFASLQLN
jgi:hypothetical protein